MKIVCISDTHNRYPEIPDGDVLVHAGDHLYQGEWEEMIPAFEWLESLPHEKKIVIAGNHDFPFQSNPPLARDFLAEFPSVTYLEDDGIKYKGIYFYGSPWQPWYYDWAFNLQRGKEIREKWDMIPVTTDVLITHGPPMGILDPGFQAPHVGCEELYDVVVNRVKPKLHVFGHLHSGYGNKTLPNLGTIFVNASVVNEKYRAVNAPQVFEI